MYLIKVEHIDKDLTYTREEQSCSTVAWKWTKYNNLVQKWIGILCPYVDHFNLFSNSFISNLNEQQDKNKMACSDCMVKYIQNYLNFLNSYDGANRKFSVEIIDLDDETSK